MGLAIKNHMCGVLGGYGASTSRGDSLRRWGMTHYNSVALCVTTVTPSRKKTGTCAVVVLARGPCQSKFGSRSLGLPAHFLIRNPATLGHSAAHEDGWSYRVSWHLEATCHMCFARVQGRIRQPRAPQTSNTVSLTSSLACRAQRHVASCTACVLYGVLFTDSSGQRPRRRNLRAILMDSFGETPILALQILMATATVANSWSPPRRRRMPSRAQIIALSRDISHRSFQRLTRRRYDFLLTILFTASGRRTCTRPLGHLLLRFLAATLPSRRKKYRNAWCRFNCFRIKIKM